MKPTTILKPFLPPQYFPMLGLLGRPVNPNVPLPSIYHIPPAARGELIAMLAMLGCHHMKSPIHANVSFWMATSRYEPTSWVVLSRTDDDVMMLNLRALPGVSMPPGYLELEGTDD